MINKWWPKSDVTLSGSHLFRCPIPVFVWKRLQKTTKNLNYFIRCLGGHSKRPPPLPTSLVTLYVQLIKTCEFEFTNKRCIIFISCLNIFITLHCIYISGSQKPIGHNCQSWVGFHSGLTTVKEKCIRSETLELMKSNDTSILCLGLYFNVTAPIKLMLG
jgi:hypothetical protein